MSDFLAPGLLKDDFILVYEMIYKWDPLDPVNKSEYAGIVRVAYLPLSVCRNFTIKSWLGRDFYCQQLLLILKVSTVCA